MEEIRNYKDRIRIFLILYIFSEEYSDINRPNLKKIFESEVRIQKLDFLLRNPDYLCHELLLIVKNQSNLEMEIKNVVRNIFSKNEPVIRKEEMLRFFYGAYEDIDNIIAFLKSIDFIHFESKRTSDLKKVVSKKYYITEIALSKFDDDISNFPALKWYVDRCNLIKKYFGDLSGSDLKVAQYQVAEYKNTSLNDYIGNIVEQVETEFFDIYLEPL